MKIKLLTAIIFIFFCSFSFSQDQGNKKIKYIINIDSDPQGAIVYFDNKIKGITPCQIEVGDESESDILVIIQKEGYAGFYTTVDSSKTIVYAKLTRQEDIENQLFTEFTPISCTLSMLSFQQITICNFKLMYYYPKSGFGIGLGSEIFNLYKYKLYESKNNELVVNANLQEDCSKESETDEILIGSFIPFQFYLIYGTFGGMTNDYGYGSLTCELGYLQAKLGEYFKENPPYYVDLRLGYTFGKSTIFIDTPLEWTLFIGTRYSWGGYFYSYGYYDDNDNFIQYSSKTTIKRENETNFIVGIECSFGNIYSY